MSERMRDDQFDRLRVIATGPGTLGSNGANLLAEEAQRARASEAALRAENERLHQEATLKFRQHAEVVEAKNVVIDEREAEIVALRADLAKAKEDHTNTEAAYRRDLNHGIEVAHDMSVELAKAKERIAELEGAASLLLEAAVVQSDGAFVAPQAFAPAVRAAWLALADARKTEP